VSTGTPDDEATLVEATRNLLAQEDWVSAQFEGAFVGPEASVVGKFVRPDGSTGVLWPALAFTRKWWAFHDSCASQERGTWFSMKINLMREPVEAEVSYNWQDRVFFDQMVPDLDPAEMDLTMPLDESWADELQRHPRSPQYVPTWLRELVGSEDAERASGDHAAVERAIAAAPTWPPLRAELASSARWSAVFDAVSEEIVRALRAETPATELLRREADDRALEQVAETATNALLTRFVEDESACAALAAELGSSNGPEGAEDDVTDAITDLVDWQLARRFEQ